MGQAGTSALGREEALQAGLLLTKLSAGCLKPPEAHRQRGAFGGPRQEWTTASSEHHHVPRLLLDVGYAESSAFELQMALQIGWQLAKLSLGCLKPPEARRRRNAFGGPRQGWSSASSEHHCHCALLIYIYAYCY